MYFNNVTNLTGLFTAANNASQGVFAYTSVITIALILFAVTIPFGRSKALIFSSFISGFVTLILGNLGMVSYWLMLPLIITFSIGVFMMVTSKQ